MRRRREMLSTVRKCGVRSPPETALRFAMTTVENVAEPRPMRPGTLRVQRHRMRRREGFRVFTVEVREVHIEHAIARGLLKPEDRAEPWTVIQACYACLLSDKALDWLVNRGVIRQEQRGDAGSILRAIGSWLGRAGS